MSNGISFPGDGSVALDREQWLQIIEDLLQVGPLLQESIARAVKDNPIAKEIYPAFDPEIFEADVRAACAAIAYVADFAADKCRFIVVKEE